MTGTAIRKPARRPLSGQLKNEYDYSDSVHTTSHAILQLELHAHAVLAANYVASRLFEVELSTYTVRVRQHLSVMGDCLAPTALQNRHFIRTRLSEGRADHSGTDRPRLLAGVVLQRRADGRSDEHLILPVHGVEVESEADCGGTFCLANCYVRGHPRSGRQGEL